MTEEIKQLENPVPEEKDKGGRPKNCGKCGKPKTQCECGRPTVMTPDVLSKLEDAFMFCFTDEEACLYAGISTTAFYNYQLENPEFKERKKALRLHPNLSAKKELVEGIKGNINQARWWAQNKMGDEFNERTTIKHEGGLELSGSVPEGALEKAVGAFNEVMRQTLIKRKPKPEPKDEKPE